MAKAVVHIISGKRISDDTLIRFFKGELSGSEKNHVQSLLQSDELYSEVYSTLSPEEFLHCIAINRSITTKIDKFTSPGGIKYYHYLGIAAIAVLLFGWWLMNDTSRELSTDEKDTTVVTQNDNPQNDNNVSEWTPYTNNWYDGDENSDGSEKESNDGSALENVIPGNIDEIYKAHTETPFTVPDKNVALNNENKTDPNIKGDDTRKFDDNPIIELNVSSAQVMVKNNLAEYDKSQTDPGKRVNDPNIGNAVITKNNKSDYDISDMPYYEGGDRVLGVYIQGHLANKISIRKKQSVENVMVSFELTAKGKVENVEVLGKNVPDNVKKEIEKVITEAPGWRSGKKSGRKGAMQYMLSISFY